MTRHDQIKAFVEDLRERPDFRVLRAEREGMAPAGDTERQLLLELHLLALHEGTYWTALRFREGEAPETYYRTTNETGRAPLDIPIGSMARYTDMLVRARGADRWQCLLVDFEALRAADAAHLRRWEVPALIDSLNALTRLPSARADAEELLDLARRLQAG